MQGKRIKSCSAVGPLRYVSSAIWMVSLFCISSSVTGCISDDKATFLLDRVPDVFQSTDYSCGPSALSAVLTYYDKYATEAQLIRNTRSNEEVGTELEDLASVALTHGLEADLKEEMGIAQLERELRQGYPVITLIQAWPESEIKDGSVDVNWSQEWDAGHYVVVIGMDQEAVIIEDPALIDHRGRIPTGEFSERWHGFNKRGERVWGQTMFVHGSPSVHLPRLQLDQISVD